MLSLPERRAIDLATQTAREWEGNTAPNPPVGAVALDTQGQVLAQAAHQKAGAPHAEASLITRLHSQNLLDQVSSIIVTLEPCNHAGRTGACTQSIRTAWPNGGVRIIYAESDPNPHVRGGGAQALRDFGFEVEQHSTFETRELIAPFAKACTTSHPWIVIKTAQREVAPGEFTLIPPVGQKTFMSSPEAIVFAHTLRKKSDAILVSSSTWLADHPLLTVRAVEDFPGRKRLLWVLDRNERLTDSEITAAATERGMVGVRDVLPDLSQSFELMKAHGVLRVLVEAGPRLLEILLKSGLWDERVVLTQTTGAVESVQRILRNTL